jgi:hypothetical protein
MHTFEYTHVDGSEVIFQHDIDFQGSVLINNGSNAIVIPLMALKVFVTSLIRNKKIEMLEIADDNTILGIKE